MTYQDPENKTPDTRLYSSPAEALKKVCSEYEYWSGKLTETSLQMCYAVVGANWVVFGSINGVLNNVWAKWSVLMVILALSANIVGALFLSETIRKRVEYAETDKPRWQDEFDRFSVINCPWPFIGIIDAVGRWMRIIKATFTLVAGVCLIVGAVLK